MYFQPEQNIIYGCLNPLYHNQNFQIAPRIPYKGNFRRYWHNYKMKNQEHKEPCSWFLCFQGPIHHSDIPDVLTVTLSPNFTQFQFFKFVSILNRCILRREWAWVGFSLTSLLTAFRYSGIHYQQLSETGEGTNLKLSLFGTLWVAKIFWVIITLAAMNAILIQIKVRFSTQ